MSDHEYAVVVEVIGDVLRRARQELSDDSVWAVICLEERIAWLRARVALLLEGTLQAALIDPYCDPNDPASYTYRLPADDAPGAGA